MNICHIVWDHYYRRAIEQARAMAPRDKIRLGLELGQSEWNREFGAVCRENENVDPELIREALREKRTIVKAWENRFVPPGLLP